MNEEIEQRFNENGKHGEPLHWCEKISSRPEKCFAVGDISEDIEGMHHLLEYILTNSEFKSLYYHQGETLKNLWEGKNVFLCTNEGSGRSTTADIFSLLTILLRHKTVLYVLPRKERLLHRENALNKRVQQTGLEWLINIQSSSQATDITSAILKGLDLVITTPEVLKEFLLEITNYEAERNHLWFSSLGFVVFEEINSYSPEELVHVKNLIKALRFQLSVGTTKPRILLTGTPIQSAKSIAGKLLGSDSNVIEYEYNQKNSYNLFFWMSHTASKEGIAKKINYPEEVMNAASKKCKPKGKYLIWHAFAALSSSELNALKNRVLSQIDSLEIQCVSQLQKLDKRYFGTVDGVFILGLPLDFKRLKDLLGNIVSQDGFVIIIPPEEPLSHFIAKNSSYLDKARLPELIVTDFIEVQRHYISRSMAALPGEKISMKELKDFWGEDAVETISSMIDDGIFTFDEESDIISVSDRKRAYYNSHNLPWGTLGGKYISLSLSENTRLNFSYALFPWKIFSGAIIYNDTDKFIVPDISGVGRLTYQLQVAPEGSPVMRFPQVEINLLEEKVIEGKYRESNFGIIDGIDIEVEESFAGYKSFRTYSHPGETTKLSTIKNARKVKGLKITKPSTHDFEHLIKIFLPYFYKDISQLIAIRHHNEAIYIYSLYQENDEVIDYLFANWDDICNSIFTLGHQLLTSCPCKSGCPLCLKPFDYSKESTDKEEMLKMLSKALNL